MIAEERNEKMKHGQEVPRSWIPDFNLTHNRAIHPPQNQTSENLSSHDTQLLKERHERKRLARQLRQRQQRVRANSDIKTGQKVIAIILALIGLLAGGLIGFSLGALAGLAILALPLEL